MKPWAERRKRLGPPAYRKHPTGAIQASLLAPDTSHYPDPHMVPSAALRLVEAAETIEEVRAIVRRFLPNERKPMHQCPTRGCQRQVDDSKLMCGPHWRLVPRVLQDAVYAAYRGGRGLGSDELFEAQIAARDHVNDALKAGGR